MSFLEWRPYLDTGIADVDAEHRGLLDLLNQAAPILIQAGGVERAVIDRLLEGLLSYAAHHFLTEETLMAAVAMEPSALEHHRATHARFTEQVREMAASIHSGDAVAGDKLLSFLASWLVMHILGEDQAMARQIRAIRGGATPADAFQQARGGDLRPSPATLSQAMVDIYTLLTRQHRQLAEAHASIMSQNAHLEELVRARTAELERTVDNLREARDVAEAASSAKSRFLGTMSHELRTPMNTISGLSRLLRDQSLPPPQHDLTRRIVESSDRLLGLISGILDYAKLHNGEQTTEAPVAFNPRAELTEASEPGFAMARQKGLDASLDVEAALAGGLIGPIRVIRRILTLFLDNAVKFTDRGHIRITVRSLTHARGGATRVRFAIEDTGPGMPDSYLSKLFQPFNQADDRPNRRHEGLGLGLALARELARSIGGEVGVESKLGQGSVFWLDLDMRPATITAGAASRLAGRETATSVTKLATAPLSKENEAALARVVGMLDTCDTRAAVELERLGAELSSRLGARFDDLRRCVDAFDYDAALSLLRPLLESAQRENHQ